MSFGFAGALWPTRRALLVLLLLTALGTVEWLRDLLSYDALATASGQWWRPLSAWLAQLNARHWLLNQWGLVVMALLLPPRLTRSGWLGFVLIWLLASLLLWRSDYSAYVGLSGLLYGWLLWAAYLSPYYSLRVRLIFAALLTLKVLSENGLLPVLGQDWVAGYIGAPVAHESHLWGLIGGWLVIGLVQTAVLYRSVRARRG